MGPWRPTRAAVPRRPGSKRPIHWPGSWTVSEDGSAECEVPADERNTSRMRVLPAGRAGAFALTSLYRVVSALRPARTPATPVQEISMTTADRRIDADRAVERLMRFLSVEGVTGREQAIGAEVEK